MAKKSAKSAARRTSKKPSATKKTPSTSKKPPAQRRTEAARGPQKRETTAPPWFRFHKPSKHPVQLPPVWQLTRTAALSLWDNRILFLAITAVYAILNLLFVQGLSSSSTSSLTTNLHHIAAGHLGTIFSSLGTFVVLFGSSSGSASPTAGLYQLVFALITTLAVIWALRQVLSGNNVRIRDVYYLGMYPIIPFILVLLMICVQLLPFVIGAKLYTTLVGGGIAVHFIEQTVSLLLLLGLTLWSLYMVTATVFALYIVTLPDMTPMQAIRSARNLVRHRRFVVLRKILYLPLLLLVLSSVIMLPIILVLPVVAPAALFILTMAGLVAANGYMYTFYRELLNE